MFSWRFNPLQAPSLPRLQQFGDCVMAKAWPWGHLLGNCFSFSTRLLQNECRKSKSSPAQSAVLTLWTGSCKLVWWPVLCCSCLTSSSSPFGVALLALWHHHPLLWGVCVKLHWIVFVKIQREVEGYITVCQLTASRSSHRDSYRTGHYKMSFHNVHQEPSLWFTWSWLTGQRAGTRALVTQWRILIEKDTLSFQICDIKVLPLWHEQRVLVLQLFPGRPCPDKTLSGNGNYGGN